MVQTKVVGLRVPFTELERVDRLVAAGKFLNRADFFRHAIRRLLEEMA